MVGTVIIFTAQINGGSERLSDSPRVSKGTDSSLAGTLAHVLELPFQLEERTSGLRKREPIRSLQWVDHDLLGPVDHQSILKG